MATAARKHDRSKTAIIVGASRGLGLGLAREFARGSHVTATARNASIAPELADVAAASYGRIEVEKVDIDLAESVDAAAVRMLERAPAGQLYQPTDLRICLPYMPTQNTRSQIGVQF
jgi:NAD(P)-dependent dehydrogenase (short-subunit alcohol dehydrogenase family)